MPFDISVYPEIIEEMENFLSRRRPPEHIRSKLDIGYEIEDQSIRIYTIRPDWIDPDIYRESDIAKATWVKTRKQWKVFWMRASGKWGVYEPNGYVDTLRDFLQLVEEDSYSCFWG